MRILLPSSADVRLTSSFLKHARCNGLRFCLRLRCCCKRFRRVCPLPFYLRNNRRAGLRNAVGAEQRIANRNLGLSFDWQHRRDGRRREAEGVVRRRGHLLLLRLLLCTVGGLFYPAMNWQTIVIPTTTAGKARNRRQW